MLEQLQQQLSDKLELLPFTNKKTVGYSPLGSGSPQLGHRRRISLSSFNPRKAAWLATAGLFVLGVLLLGTTTSYVSDALRQQEVDDDAPIPLGKSVDRGGREVFWWEQFPRLNGFYKGRHEIVPPSEYVPEQQQAGEPFLPRPSTPVGIVRTDTLRDDALQCAIDPPTIRAHHGMPQGMPSPLFGSLEEMAIDTSLCYDRMNRFQPYGMTGLPEEGGLAIPLRGDSLLEEEMRPQRQPERWSDVQEDCVRRNAEELATRPRTAFILRTWHTFNYTPYRIMILRAMINELSLRSGGQVYVHFLIHVQDDSLPIWASEELYNETLRNSLPPEFEGMGTLWSVAQMKLIYPPPFPKSIVNFSGGDVYEAYRSLHFPLQYFASKHPEFDYFWQWEMDIRVTGHYGELLDKVTAWADKQDRSHLWERSSKYFIPALHNNSYASFAQSIIEETAASGNPPISGPQLPADQLLPIPSQPPPTASREITDLITFSPLFNPNNTRWAFHNDITGYNTATSTRPPTRAALIAATRLSRRLLLLMHEETYRNKHTMFPEMYPASIALHYGLKAVYAPITTYMDRDWPAQHADEIFNNAVVGAEGKAAGMDHGKGHFHGQGGSVFGPGEHVFRGSSWYSNAGFAGYLWRRWLGEEKGNGEVEWEGQVEGGNGRMCLPMMILHPVKSDT
ncbi:hypothetical protein OHC33_010579 [Knufia fluminis]|uniref:Uncharacterized protein n=1 Tax=Knufia fluminis TaxID=191047 RepID=A0AAN8EFH0_9EURO|nr:hypothetical protein OHC33_010579 [Knufia fluminis]